MNFIQLSDAEKDRMVGEAYELLPICPECKKEKCYHSCPKFHRPFSQSVDECLRLAREKGIDVCIFDRQIPDAVGSIVWIITVELRDFDVTKIGLSDGEASTVPLALCLALLRFAGKEVG